MKQRTGELVFFWILLAIVGFLVYSVMSSYIVPIFLALVFSVMFAPLHRKFLAVTHGRKTLAALLTSITVFCVLVIPLIFFVSILFQEVFVLYQSIAHGGGAFSLFDRLLFVLDAKIKTFIPAFQLRANFSQYAETGFAWLLGNINVFFANIVSFILDASLFLVSVFIFSRHGKRLRASAIAWSPLVDSDDERMLSVLEDAINSVIKGAIFSALVQGALVGIGFALFHISSPVLWGAVAFVSAFVPPLGSALITVPASLFMMFSGHIGLGIGLLVWGTFVGLIDNIIKPLVMKKGTSIHPFIILLSVIGGIAYFGPLGFIEGPVVIAGFFALLELYPQVAFRENNDTPRPAQS